MSQMASKDRNVLDLNSDYSPDASFWLLPAPHSFVEENTKVECITKDTEQC